MASNPRGTPGTIFANGQGRSIGSSRRFLGLHRFSMGMRQRNGVYRIQPSPGYAWWRSLSNPQAASEKT